MISPIGDSEKAPLGAPFLFPLYFYVVRFFARSIRRSFHPASKVGSAVGARGSLSALSPVGCFGTTLVDPLDPAQAVDGAARMLSRDLDRFGRLDLAVAAYNAGAGAVQRHGGIPPYPETQQYVRRVLGSLGVS